MGNDIILAQKINTYHHILMLQKKKKNHMETIIIFPG